MMSHPIFGLGIGNFEKAECTISEKARPRRRDTASAAPRRTTPLCRPAPSWAFPAWFSGRRFRILGIFALLRLGRRLPYRWRRGTREQRFLRLACPYFAVALVGFTATCFFLNFAWMEPYYVLGAFVAALMGVITARVARKRWNCGRSPRGPAATRRRLSRVAEPVPCPPRSGALPATAGDAADRPPQTG